MQLTTTTSLPSRRMTLRGPVDLPQDVGRLIFEAAAEIRSDGLACACARVSKQVQSWCAAYLPRLSCTNPYSMLRVEPILYREVKVGSDGLFHRTVTASRSTKPPDFFTMHVKALLFLSHTAPALHIRDILERCNSVRSLALWASQLGSRELRDVLTSDLLAPTHISLHGYILGTEDPETFSYPIFRNVTHLEPLCNDYANWDWSSLSNLQHLTHLNIGLHFTFTHILPVVTDILSHAPTTLRVLVISCAYPLLLTDKDVRALNRGDVDPRVVVASGLPEHGSFALSASEAVEEWARPSTARVTTWSLAEDIIRGRRAVAEGRIVEL